MIISASYRTDIPAFYGRWFLNRLAAGFCQVVNPYGGPSQRIDLTPMAVDAYVFWTRNIGPFGEALAVVRDQGKPFVVQVTVTGYPRTLDRRVIAVDRAVAQMRAIRSCYGPRAVVWRYDPIVIGSLTTPAWHSANFRQLAAQLNGTTDEVVISFLEPYRKTSRNLDAAARLFGFTWRVPSLEERCALVGELAAIAAEHGMALTLCTQPALVPLTAAAPAQCIDVRRLSDCAGRPIRARRKGNRPGCACAESRDLGAYDTCPHGCVYCYAVASRPAAQRRLAGHDPDGPLVAGSAAPITTPG